ncbi:MAG: hypothetical protein ACLPUT_00240 [Solirubrobacteraceae bacterium]
MHDPSRSERSRCGDAARVSEQLKRLRTIGAIVDDRQLLSLCERARHLELLDLLDRIAGNLHMRAFQTVSRHLFAPSDRSSEGASCARAARTPGPSENVAAIKAYNYTRAAYMRSRARAGR